MQPKTLFKFILLVALSVVLTMLTLVLGAIPMRAARKSFGRGMYWVGFLVTSAMIALLSMRVQGVGMAALLFFAFTIMIGFFSEVEEQAGTVFTSGFVAIIGAVGLGAIGGGIWLYQAKASVAAYLRGQADEIVKQVVMINPKATVTADAVLNVLPSAFVVVMVFTLAAALIWEKRALKWFQLQKKENRPFHERLVEFRVPDVFVWVSILAALGAVLKHELPWLETASFNLIYVLVALYFFQGLAIVARAFKTFQVGVFWQGFWYIMIFAQLFLLVSVLGFVDFWVDFRKRLAKRPAQTQKKF